MGSVGTTIDDDEAGVACDVTVATDEAGVVCDVPVATDEAGVVCDVTVATDDVGVACDVPVATREGVLLALLSNCSKSGESVDELRPVSAASFSRPLKCFS